MLHYRGESDKPDGVGGIRPRSGSEGPTMAQNNIIRHDTYVDTMSQLSVRSPNYNEEIKDRTPNQIREIESMHKVPG